jgi:D-glycero-D-manno-heptose 1,7-bisphosphate phosphatase
MLGHCGPTLNPSLKLLDFFSAVSKWAKFMLSQSCSMKLGIFIERDGVLNQAKVERQHQVGPTTLDQFRVRIEAAPLLQRLKAAGFVLIATTNQPGLSRGYQSRRELDLMHLQLRRALPLDDIFVCPHDETDSCPCRKPKAGLLKEAAFTWHLNLDRSFVISDKWQDAEAAYRASCTSLLIESPWLGTAHHDLVLPDLKAVVEKILQLQTVNGPVFA